MTMCKKILLSILLASSPVVIATPGTAAGAQLVLVAAGTAKEQAACRPDVRRFCSKVHESPDSGAFLSCLEANRSKLSKACLAVLTSHGQ
jgi:hypothetical protein